ncbi:MAG TPA: MAPEG family protein [Nevskiaceae bacterium]|nr:MAPEG family protein [Nevskiaceae bacterium]
MDYALTTVVTVLSLILYFVLTFNVGRARGKHKIDAPAMTGHPEFERVLRVQMNTLEQLALYLPGLWLFSIYVSSIWGAVLGGVWIVGRVLYARGYYVEAGKRSAGFLVSIGATGLLLLGALLGAIYAMVQG